jgi:hypothetical protein
MFKFTAIGFKRPGKRYTTNRHSLVRRYPRCRLASQMTGLSQLNALRPTICPATLARTLAGNRPLSSARGKPEAHRRA